MRKPINILSKIVGAVCILLIVFDYLYHFNIRNEWEQIKEEFTTIELYESPTDDFNDFTDTQKVLCAILLTAVFVSAITNKE